MDQELTSKPRLVHTDVVRIQDFIADQSLKEMDVFLGAVNRLDPDRIDWTPTDGARSALSQVQELAVMPDFLENVIATKVPPSFDAAFMAAYTQACAKLGTLEIAASALRLKTGEFATFLRQIPDDQLAIEIPFGEKAWTIAAVMNYHAWNLGYHTGQVNYIGSLIPRPSAD